MCEKHEYTKLLQILISNVQDLLRNLSLEITLIYNVVQCCSHDIFGGNHFYDEREKLIWPNVHHKLESIW